LEWIGVEGGSVVLDIQIVKPGQFIQHETRAEPNRAPVFCVMIYPLGLLNEFRATSIESPIMMQVVHTNLEAIASQPIEKLFGNLVRTRWNEIERGSNPQPHFQLGESSDAVEANLR